MLLHVAEVGLRIIGVSTVLNALVWLRKRAQEKLENRVLNTFSPDRNWHWQTGYGVVSRMKRDALYRYADALFPPQIKSWSSLASWIHFLVRRFTYSCWRTVMIPSRRRADSTLRDLWKRGLLVSPPENPLLYRLR